MLGETPRDLLDLLVLSKTQTFSEVYAAGLKGALGPENILNSEKVVDFGLRLSGMKLLEP